MDREVYHRIFLFGNRIGAAFLNLDMIYFKVMKVLLIGSGGREHSLALKISQSTQLTQLFIAPGNPGTALCGENVPIKADDIPALLRFSQEQSIDLVMVGPEMPLAKGIVDVFEQHHIPIIGPTKAGAQLESSKGWAKNLMLKYGIPTADYRIFSELTSARNYLLQKNTYPIVLKADGLAAGKGVTVAASFEEAMKALEDCFVKGVFLEAGNQVVIEDFLVGEEASILAFTDGDTVLPMIAAQDHKAVFDGDKGPNTGGMGAYAPAPLVTDAILADVITHIFLPLVQGLKAEGILYKGILYAGLMIHQNQARVVEFNVRFGDPETQVVLPLLENDLLDIFRAIVERKLSRISLRWKPASAVCVILASDGYPGVYENGVPIEIGSDLKKLNDIQVIHAGTMLDQNQQLVTHGGRVLGVVGVNHDLKSAIQLVYSAIPLIQFRTKYFRNDIGKKALRM